MVDLRNSGTLPELHHYHAPTLFQDTMAREASRRSEVSTETLKRGLLYGDLPCRTNHSNVLCPPEPMALRLAAPRSMTSSGDW